MQLECGKSYKICGYTSTIQYAFINKLCAIGLLPGVIFTVIRSAPCGNTLQIQANIGNYAVRAHELQDILLELV